jgi:Ca2+-binding EF-hand superfamily protein
VHIGPSIRRKQVKFLFSFLFKKVFPRCRKPDFIVENIMKVFDTECNGYVSFRELLMAFSMSMKGTPREKLHWAFRLYDKDGDEVIDEDEMEDVFVRLCKIADNMEAAEAAVKNKTPMQKTPVVAAERPPTTDEKEKKMSAGDKKVKVKKNLSVGVQVQVQPMSNKLSGRHQMSKSLAGPKKVTKADKAAKEKAKAEAEAAASAAAAEAAALEAAEEERKANGDDDDEEEPFDPKQSAREIFKSLDVNRDGHLTEDEFVEGCLSDPLFLMMLETFSCDFMWGDGFR